MKQLNDNKRRAFELIGTLMENNMRYTEANVNIEPIDLMRKEPNGTPVISDSTISTLIERTAAASVLDQAKQSSAQRRAAKLGNTAIVDDRIKLQTLKNELADLVETIRIEEAQAAELAKTAKKDRAEKEQRLKDLMERQLDKSPEALSAEIKRLQEELA
jgi:hypothetical protein